MNDFTNEITAYALKNAIEFGKADPIKILPKLFQHGLEKSEIKEVMPSIKNICSTVNKLNEEERNSQYKDLAILVRTRDEEEKGLPERAINKKEKPVFRIAPFPSGALHLGNAKTFILNSLYAEKYNAKLLLVMDDTIGSVEKPIEKEAYKLIEEALQWLNIKYEKKITYKSDRLKIYYKYAEELIKKG